MKDIKKFSILAVLFIFCGLNTVFSSSSVLVVTRKSDTGNDPCKRSDCLSLDGLESYSDQQSSSSSATLSDLAIAGSTDLIEIKININQDTPNGNFSFPWHIKVFSVDGRDLGKSKEFGIEAFNTHIEYAGLRSAKIDADLFSQIINKSILVDRALNDQPCLIDDCGYLYSEIELVFKLYSGDSQVTEECSSLISPSLVGNSYEDSIVFKTCDCDNSRLEPRSLNQKIGHLDNSKLISTNPSFDWKSDIPAAENKSSIYNREDLLRKRIRFYPNPARSVAWLESQFNYGQDVHIEILDLKGIVVKQLLLYAGEKRKLNLQEIGDGLFILRVRAGNAMIHQKIILRK